MQSDFSVDKILVFRTFLSQNCYTLFCCSFQLELARRNYINQKIWTFKRFVVIIQKNTSNIWASQNRLCKSWIECHWNIWKRLLIQTLLCN